MNRGIESKSLAIPLPGTKLRVTYYPQSGEGVKGLVVFLHGQAVLPRMYGLNPEPWTSRGLVFAHFAQRGHGGTRGNYSYHQCALDAFEVMNQLAAHLGTSPSTRRFMITHSAGCLGLFRMLIDEGLPLDGLAMTCPALTREMFRHNHEFRFEKNGQTGFEAWMDQFSPEPDISIAFREFLSDPDWIYHPERLEGDYRGVFRNRAVRWGAFKTDDWERALRDWYEIIPWGELDWGLARIPIMTVLGAQDEWIPRDRLESIHQRLGSKRKRLIVVPDGDHILRGAWDSVASEVAPFFLGS